MQIDTTRSLPVQLTDAEVAERIREAKTREDTIDRYKIKLAELGEQTKATKEDIAAELREVSRLVRVADAREEPREVECRWSFELSTNTATLVRIDTGELVQARPMTVEERRELEQAPLDFAKAEEEAKAKAKRRTN